MPLYFARRFDAAIAHWKNALEMHRNYRLLHLYMASAYLGQSRYQEAVEELQKSIELSGAGSWEKSLLSYTYGRMGRTADARRLLSEVLAGGDPDAYDIALAYVGLGEADNAFNWLEKAVDTRMGAFNEVNVDPIFDRIRSEPRFAALLRRIRLPKVTTPQVVTASTSASP
jgi:tetratricopeptide (TPR) repeat protein